MSNPTIYAVLEKIEGHLGRGEAGDRLHEIKRAVNEVRWAVASGQPTGLAGMVISILLALILWRACGWNF